LSAAVFRRQVAHDSTTGDLGIWRLERRDQFINPRFDRGRIEREILVVEVAVVRDCIDE
jgi:hypothetical protein